ncbi:hypothetical protein OC835_006143 [Tilletia horrida]|nr:hypothetical protein OC835_006143 [Tilletia horrida]
MAASSSSAAAAAASRLRRWLPYLPPFALVTVYTSVAYNYAVQARLRREDAHLHALRLAALQELRTCLLAASGTESGRERREEEELVRALGRLGVDPARMGYAHLVLSSSSSSSDAGGATPPTATATLFHHRTGWSDVLFGGPNSHRVRALSSSSSSSSSSSAGENEGEGKQESLGASLRQAATNALKDFSIFGGGGPGIAAGVGASAGSSKRIEEVEEEQALQAWLEQALESDSTDKTGAAGQPAPSPPSPALTPGITAASNPAAHAPESAPVPLPHSQIRNDDDNERIRRRRRRTDQVAAAAAATTAAEGEDGQPTQSGAATRTRRRPILV